MRDAFDDFEFDEMIGHQAQSPAGVSCRRLRTGKLGDACLDLSGDLDLPARSGSRLALQGLESPDFATAFAQALNGADGQSGDPMDFTVYQRRAVETFVGEEQRHRGNGFGGLAALLVADDFEFPTLEF